MSGRQPAESVRITTLIHREKAHRGVPGQANRLGCTEPPPFSLPWDVLRPDTTPADREE